MAPSITFLNYKRDNFEQVASRCSKVKLEEMENPFKYVDMPLFIEGLLKKSFKKEGSSNINFHFFIDGIFKQGQRNSFFQKWGEAPQPFTKKVQAMETSLRVTNVQNIDSIVKNICYALTCRFGMPTVCNMYITPNRVLNCLSVHSDYHEMFVFQLMGKKRWLIYQNEKKEDLRLLSSEAKKCNHKPYRTIEIAPRDVLYLPYDTVHKAECIGDFPSIHLTFSVCLRRREDVYRYLFDTIKDEMERSYCLRAPIDLQSLKLFYETFQSAVSSLDDPMEMYNEKQFLEAISFHRNGRPY